MIVLSSIFNASSFTSSARARSSRSAQVDGPGFEDDSGERVDAVGTGQQELGSVDDDQPWLAIDDETRIRVDKIVSVTLNRDVRREGWRPL